MNKLYIKEGYYDNGSLLFQEYFLDQEMTIRHNDDGPAYIEFYENGNKKEEFYYFNGHHYAADRWTRIAQNCEYRKSPPKGNKNYVD